MFSFLSNKKQTKEEKTMLSLVFLAQYIFLGLFVLFLVFFFNYFMSHIHRSINFNYFPCRSQQIQVVLLNIEHILSGYKNTVHHMNGMALLVVVAVKEWRSVKSAPKTFRSPPLSIYVFSFLSSDMFFFNRCSQGTQNIFCLMMAASYVWSV